MVDGTVVGGGVTLSVEVALDGGVVMAQPLPINLIKIIRLEDEGADDASAWGGLGDDSDLSEEDVLGGAHGGGVGGLVDDEVGSVGVVGHGGAISKLPEVAGALGEVGDESCAEGRVGRAGWRGG